MTDAGILLGLPRDKAHDLIVQSAIGAAVMLRDSGEHPVKLREAVTSPAGTTISAIRELENHGVRAALSPPWRPPATAAANWPPATADPGPSGGPRRRGAGLHPPLRDGSSPTAP